MGFTYRTTTPPSEQKKSSKKDSDSDSDGGNDGGGSSSGSGSSKDNKSFRLIYSEEKGKYQKVQKKDGKLTEQSKKLIEEEQSRREKGQYDVGQTSGFKKDLKPAKGSKAARKQEKRKQMKKDAMSPDSPGGKKITKGERTEFALDPVNIDVQRRISAGQLIRESRKQGSDRNISRLGEETFRKSPQARDVEKSLREERGVIIKTKKAEDQTAGSLLRSIRERRDFLTDDVFQDVFKKSPQARKIEKKLSKERFVRISQPQKTKQTGKPETRTDLGSFIRPASDELKQQTFNVKTRVFPENQISNVLSKIAGAGEFTRKKPVEAGIKTLEFGGDVLQRTQRSLASLGSAALPDPFFNIIPEETFKTMDTTKEQFKQQSRTIVGGEAVGLAVKGAVGLAKTTPPTRVDPGKIDDYFTDITIKPKGGGSLQKSRAQAIFDYDEVQTKLGTFFKTSKTGRFGPTNPRITIKAEAYPELERGFKVVGIGDDSISYVKNPFAIKRSQRTLGGFFETSVPRKPLAPTKPPVGPKPKQVLTRNVLSSKQLRALRNAQALDDQIITPTRTTDRQTFLREFRGRNEILEKLGFIVEEEEQAGTTFRTFSGVTDKFLSKTVGDLPKPRNVQTLKTVGLKLVQPSGGFFLPNLGELKDPEIGRRNKPTNIIDRDRDEVPGERFINLPNTDFDIKPGSLERQGQRVKPKLKEDVVPQQVPDLDLTPRRASVPKRDVTPATDTTPITTPVTGINIPVVRDFEPPEMPEKQQLKETFFKPKLPSTGRRFKQKKNVFKGFKVEVKKRGVFKPLPGVFTKRSALGLGGRKVDVTKAATFRIKPVKTLKRPKETSDDFEEEKFREFKIRKGKKVKTPRTFIEKRRFRMDVGQEQKQVSSFRIPKVKGFKI